MDIKTFFEEIWSLIKKEKWTILLSTGIITVLALAVLFVLQSDFSSNKDQDTVEESTNPVKMEVYIEQDLEGAFANSYLLEILMTQPDVVAEIEEETQVDIYKVLEEFAEDNEPIYSSDDPINVERNPSSNVMEMVFEIGNDVENYVVAEAYRNWLITNDSPFFDNKNIFIVSEPSTMENGEIAGVGSRISARALLIQSVIGVTFGMIIGFGIAVLKTLFSENIRYGFAYGWAPHDLYIKEESGASDKKIAHDILSSDMDSLVIISEQEVSLGLQKELEKLQEQEYIIVKEIAELPVAKKVDEFIFVITRDQTTKKWYHNQRKDLQLYPNARIKIVEKS
jgi:hypothetical protein